MPLFFMELSLSQYIGLGPIGCWKAISPVFQGIGYAMLILSFLVCVYYNTIIAWIFYYLFESFRADIPWRDCKNPWNSYDKCYEGKSSGNGIVNQTFFNTTTNKTMFMLSCAKHYIPFYAVKSDLMSTISTNLSIGVSNITTTPFAVDSKNISGEITTTSTTVNVSIDMIDKLLFNCTYSQKVRLLPADEYLT